MSEDDSSTLVIILETHDALWKSITTESGPAESAAANFIEQVLAFVQGFLLLSESNKVAIFASHDKSSPLLYASPALLRGQQIAASGQQAHIPREQFKDRLSKLAAATGDGQAGDGPALAGALSRVLCFLHKQHLGTAQTTRDSQRKARILCIQASPDVSAQYIAFMNAVFSAQRNDVVIDACTVGGVHSSLLQQACHLTGGIYLKPARMAALLQYFLMVYAGDTHNRSFLMLPQTQGVDFRASCFCHKRAIDLGFVCSVCLSIFCESLQECSTCGTIFPAAEVGSKRKGLPLPGPSSHRAAGNTVH